MITQLQSAIRGMLGRKRQEERRQELQSLSLDLIIRLQAYCRGLMTRLCHQRKIEYYHAHIDQIIKVQSLIKNKLVNNAYHRLTHDHSPSVNTVKSFVHLLDDSDLDFDRELELEDLRQDVIEHIRGNNQLEGLVTALDIQIALFLKNAITIEEALKQTGALKKKKKEQKRMILTAEAAANHHMDPFSLSVVDKESRQRLEVFQQMIYCLQTEPQYLARLLFLTNRQDLGHYSSHKLIESTVLSLFGYATNVREEYLLINLCKVKAKKRWNSVVYTRLRLTL